MTRLIAVITRALREQPEEMPHVHSGSEGPYVCHDPRCESPSLV